eukprot:6629523-Alexandrium_andersonii.AAC.1
MASRLGPSSAQRKDQARHATGPASGNCSRSSKWAGPASVACFARARVWGLRGQYGVRGARGPWGRPLVDFRKAGP